ncbi:hypothetical protein I9W82_005342 [Candida metapsilosis]|uniref:Dopey N-terminal domain-containing protein n=1 Tax=Candida metapsilosis TaxID=273372 RepID=A0A8H7ZF50_9ASCO|nr:hypothetical protein I9W82_005342 [Candida metapsilosis]
MKGIANGDNSNFKIGGMSEASAGEEGAGDDHDHDEDGGNYMACRMKFFAVPVLHGKNVSTQWPIREAAILAFGAMSNSFISLTSDKLPELVPFLIDRLKISRGEEAHEGGEYATFFHPTFQFVVACALDPKEIVQEAACSALSAIQSDPELLEFYLEPPFYSVISTQKYEQSVDKTLALFDTLEEWADYIAFLSKLQKTLQSYIDSDGEGAVGDDAPHFYVPHASQVSYRLALCLSPNLPNGVHQKTLNIYEFIFDSLSQHQINSEVSIWLPGLLPLISYSSIQIKPQQIKILKSLIVDKLSRETSRKLIKPLVLWFLSGLEDAHSEVFNDIHSLMVAFKSKLQDDSQFWHCIFICIITTPERRIGALNWCERNLPEFTNTKDEQGNPLYSQEAQLCMKPEAGLLVRAFAIVIGSSSLSSDILVTRGFFDLLLSRVPLDSAIFDSKVTPKDKDLLIMSCCKITLNKDVSLNRRVLNYFLGPDIDSDSESRREYFKKNAKDSLSRGLVQLGTSESKKDQLDALKMAFYLIMDKWEINYELTPELFSPFLYHCFAKRDDFEIMKTAMNFFDETESSYIWNEVFKLIVKGKSSNYDVIEFIIKHFHLNEDENVEKFAPLVLACILTDAEISNQKMELMEMIFGYIQWETSNEIDADVSISSTQLLGTVTEWTEQDADHTLETIPYSSEKLTSYIFKQLEMLYLNYSSNLTLGTRIGNLLTRLFDTIESDDVKQAISERFVSQWLKGVPSSLDSREIPIALTRVNMLNHVSKFINVFQREKCLKFLLTRLWQSVISSDPANHQVEAVKSIFELKFTFSMKKIEGGTLELFLNLPLSKQIVAFEALYIHSIGVNEAENILSRLFQLILDASENSEPQQSELVLNLIHRLIGSDRPQRLFNLCFNPLTKYGFMESGHFKLVPGEDFSQYAFDLKQVLTLLNLDSKHVKHHISSDQFAVPDVTHDHNEHTLQISYKRYLILLLKENRELITIEDPQRYRESEHCAIADLSLNIYMKLITGNEKGFDTLFEELLVDALNHIAAQNRHIVPDSTIGNFLQCIFHFLDRASASNTKLNLLHVHEQEKGPILVNLIQVGVTQCQSPNLLEKYMNLIIKSAYLFGDSIFNILLTLTETVVQKIDSLFNRFLNWDEFSSNENFDDSMIILFDGLENFLTVSHGYLMHSSAKVQLQSQMNKDSANNGFLNTVMSGVFQIESPSTKDTEQNKHYSTLISFHDATKISFKIWDWADSKATVPDHVTNYSDRSLTFISYKLKFRTKTFLDRLIELERQEIVNTLVTSHIQLSSVLKLLNILDNGRSQVTLPYLFNYIRMKFNPQLFLDANKTYVESDVDTNELSSFIVAFYDFMDSDTILDIWTQTLEFLDSTTSQISQFEPIVPAVLKICNVMSVKTNSSRNRDISKNKKLLSESFTKLFNSYVSHHSLSKAKSAEGDDVVVYGQQFIDALTELIPVLDEIYRDSEKTNHAVGLIINNVVLASTKKKQPHLSNTILQLLFLIGQYHPNRIWRSTVADLFNDGSFFTTSTCSNDKWKEIIHIWIEHDKDKVDDKINKLAPSSTTSPAGTLFNWNEDSEIEAKVNTLRQLSYIILAQPHDYFANKINQLFDRLNQLLSLNTCPTAIRIEISTLFRAIVLKISDIHLISHWALIIHELQQIFGLISSPPKSIKDLTSIPSQTLQLILFASKLLDELLIVDPDGFNLNSWLFISIDFETKDTQTNSIIDLISKNNDFTFLKNDAIKLNHGDLSDEYLSPLLEGVRHISSITQLRLFFDSLSMIHYERTYSLKPVNYKACQQDIIHDLITITKG